MHDKKLDAAAIFALSPVIPVVTLDNAEDATPLARALFAGGLRTMEITLRTPAALGAIRAAKQAAPQLIVGAGTVLNGADLNAAIAAGADFVLSPGATPDLVAAAKVADCTFIPGVATASEIMRGLELGYDHFKFFPAEQLGGCAALKSLGAPLPKARFCPTGSITPARAPDYLALTNVVCVGGSWIATSGQIKAKDWSGIETAARAASQLACAAPQ